MPLLRLRSYPIAFQTSPSGHATITSHSTCSKLNFWSPPKWICFSPWVPSFSEEYLQTPSGPTHSLLLYASHHANVQSIITLGQFYISKFLRICSPASSLYHDFLLLGQIQLSSNRFHTSNHIAISKCLTNKV